jgi:hypothetical protein
LAKYSGVVKDRIKTLPKKIQVQKIKTRIFLS